MRRASLTHPPRRFLRTLSAAPISLALLGNQLFPADNPWNQKITDAPVAPNSVAVMNSIISTFGDGHLHPDFGEDSYNTNPLYGIPYNVVHGNTITPTSIVIDNYASQSDIQAVPLPANPVLEGDLQNGPLVGLNNRGDSHLLVYDEDHNIAYEFYNASRPSENADGKWHAAQESVWNLNTDSFRTLGFTSADAAGLPILPGLVRPDEALPVSEGGQGIITHAIRFTLQNSVILDQFLYPASHVANPGNNNPATEPPMGARFRLKASVDISHLSPESKIIAQAMKDYGLILADNGSNFFFSGASYSVDANNNHVLTWNDNDIQSSTTGLKSLTYSDFEMVSLTPIVTAISKPIAPANSVITITGQNFSGAAGHLQVLFGTTPGRNVTIQDDAHLTVTVPAGITGQVDIQVQSGSPDPNDSENINAPLFGYGTSATVPADKFTPALAGDADENGTVDLSDLSTVLNNFGQTTSAWTSGNFDAQPTIDLTDLSDVLNNFGTTYPSASIATTPIPEPASLTAISLPLLAFLLRHKPPSSPS
jgi:hypothetical protein